VEKAIIYGFAFCVAGDAGEEGTFDSVLNLKYFIHAVKVSVAHSKVSVRL